jgi:hypothetical protein
MSDKIDACRQAFEEWYRPHYGLSENETISGHTDYIVWRAAWHSRHQAQSGDAIKALQRMQVTIENNTTGGSYDDYDTVKASLSRAQHREIEGGWQPIEIAPKDGGYFLVCLPRLMNLIVRARFDTVHKQWLSERDNDGAIYRVEFFHAGDLWMPMPKPPAPPKGE